MVCLTARANVPALRHRRPTADAGKFESLSIFMHWNIGQYKVLTNSISDMLPKCRVERSGSSHNNASSTAVWANGSLDLYPALPTLRYENLLYFIFYIQSILSKIISYTLVNQIMCTITLHRPLWEHLGNRRAGRGTHLSKGSSTTVRAVVDITPTISHLHEMRKSCSLYVYVWMSVLCHMVYVCETMWMICYMFVRQCGWYGVCLRQSGW
jgi:hypothetical protein